MAVTVWDCMARWSKKGKVEEDFADGASFEVTLEHGETVPGEIRVFKAEEGVGDDQDAPHTGVRCLVNGQSHGKRDARFFRAKAVNKEHIAGSILVTLFCEGLSQASKNHLFLSNRETLREGTVLDDLLGKLQTELHDHEALVELNQRRYAEKVKDAVKDDDGIKALEELLSTDPQLANLFGTLLPGTVAAATAPDGTGVTVPGKAGPLQGCGLPDVCPPWKGEGAPLRISQLPQGDVVRVSFNTDVKNNYFTRRKPPRGSVTFCRRLARSVIPPLQWTPDIYVSGRQEGSPRHGTQYDDHHLRQAWIGAVRPDDSTSPLPHLGSPRAPSSGSRASGSPGFRRARVSPT